MTSEPLVISALWVHFPPLCAELCKKPFLSLAYKKSHWLHFPRLCAKDGTFILAPYNADCLLVKLKREG